MAFELGAGLPPVHGSYTRPLARWSRECLSAANAVRCARSPSPYSSTAWSWVLTYVSCAFFGERLIVLGILRRHADPP